METPQFESQDTAQVSPLQEQPHTLNETVATNGSESAESESAASSVSPFQGMDCSEMITAFAEMLRTKPISELRTEAEHLKSAFYNKRRHDLGEQSNPTENSDAPEDELSLRLKDVLAQYRILRSEYMQKTAVEQEANLHKKQALIEELKHLMERQDDFNVIFSDFKALQQRWQDTGAASPAYQNELWRTYNHNVEKFYDMVKINRALREMDFKRNLELKQLLCEKTEELLRESKVVDAFKKLQQYHEQWREIGPVAQEHRITIWERFKEASAQINKMHNAYFERQKQERQDNLLLKQTLCEQTEALAATPPAAYRTWNEHTEQILEIQKRWKSIGATPTKENEAIYRRFRSACNTFFDARKAYFTASKEKYEEILHKKTALCEQAEALASNDDLRKATAAMIALQKEWKEIDTQHYKRTDEVWNRFRAASDAFFTRKKERYAEMESTFEQNLKDKEALLSEAKNYTPSGVPQENVEVVTRWQQRWAAVGRVPKADSDRIQNSYRETLESLHASMGVSDLLVRIQMRKGQADTPASPQELRLQLDTINKQIKKLEAEKRTWENNITFFARSKNAEQLTADVRKNINAHAQTIASLTEEARTIAQAMPPDTERKGKQRSTFSK